MLRLRKISLEFNNFDDCHDDAESQESMKNELKRITRDELLSVMSSSSELDLRTMSDEQKLAFFYTVDQHITAFLNNFFEKTNRRLLIYYMENYDDRCYLQVCQVLLKYFTARGDGDRVAFPGDGAIYYFFDLTVRDESLRLYELSPRYLTSKSHYSKHKHQSL